MLVFLGLVVIVLGVVRIAFPNIVRSLDRFSNEWEGVETKQGEAYELNRIISGAVMIIAGIVIIYAANNIG